ncbi:MAG: DUF4922 domain-containing protein [Deltaproteobacteria bacterium]|nr:DUF4922 domain-containing protein [Deltaproteobacteria bacterium]
MSWDKKLLATAQTAAELPGLIDRLFEQQLRNWQTLAEGEASLAGIKSKTLSTDNARIVVQANPGRRKSTHAKVDRLSVAKRPCFLCPANMPAEERGIGFEEFVILPNPYPVLKRHCTIPARQHSPQRLDNRIAAMLRLARAVGHEMLVFYNGPRCGASAPDHFHFQACRRDAIGLLEQLDLDALQDQKFPLTSFGRRMIIFNNREIKKAQDNIADALAALASTGADDLEPLINVLALFWNERYLTVLFPRAKHRPKCFFAEDDSQIAISPAALEMAGILVVAEPDHFDRLDQATARSIYEEVTIDRDRFSKLTEVVT